MNKKQVLERYERADDGRIYIDVAAPRTEDLYSDFDKCAPYLRRDLQPDLVDYLIECAREVAKEVFVLRFTLAQPADQGSQQRIRQSVHGFFIYLREHERRKLREMLRRAVILLVSGLAILWVSVRVNQSVWAQSVTGNVFAEGLTVAAWVAMWESLALLMIEFYPLRREIRLYLNLASAPVLIRAESDLPRL